MSLLAELFAPTIPGRVQAVAVASSVVLLGAVIHFIRRGQLKAGYSIIWFVIGLALVVLSLATRLLDSFARLVGINYSPAALVLVLGGGLFILALHYSVMVTKHDRRIRELAQEHALLKAQLRLEKQSPVTGVSVAASEPLPLKEKVQ
ncbi:hypothetical protein CL628_00660 [bacterium]|nr:hypothetical protein [bacterium]